MARVGNIVLASSRSFDAHVPSAASRCDRLIACWNRDHIRVNSSADFTLARAVALAMKAKRYGKIFNFCSLTLNGRWDGYVPHVAAKGAMLGLTKSLARELGPHGIRVNAISPGAVVSEAKERVFADRLQQYNDWILENQSLKSRIQPEHIADLVLFSSPRRRT
jgi:NAD(P)-dependent dehydrogenase (short-subunit alcohol dehydrogenase family)